MPEARNQQSMCKAHRMFQEILPAEMWSKSCTPLPPDHKMNFTNPTSSNTIQSLKSVARLLVFFLLIYCFESSSSNCNETESVTIK